MKKLFTSNWFRVPVGILILLLGLYFYKAQFKGDKQKISFSTDIELQGLLLRPDTEGPHPAIILLHGAGGSRQTYDKAFFRFHANAFLEKGFAVLVYTKRGSGDDGFNYDLFRYKDLANDAFGAISYLRRQKDIDQDNIGLMGVSESGWFTPELAYRDGNLKFIINRVSAPFSFERTVIHEVRMDAMSAGFTEQEIEKRIVPLTSEIWQYYREVAKDPSLASGPYRDRLNTKIKTAHEDKKLNQWFQYDSLEPYDTDIYASRGSNFAYDPMPYFEKIDLPMFYVLAGQDKNIPTAAVVDFLKEYRTASGRKIEVKVFPDASHYLFKWGLEDGPYEGILYQKGYMEAITSWAVSQVSNPSN